MMPLARETRSGCILRHLAVYQHETGVSSPTLAQSIAERYHDLVPAELRTVTFHTDGDPYKCMRANAQLLRRITEGEVRLPSDLEEAMIEALPERRRQVLQHQLAARVGLMAVKTPTWSDQEDQHNLAEFWRETGEAAEAVLSLIQGDGSIGPEDRDRAELTIAELDDVIAVAGSIKAKIIIACGVNG